jgi:hypothetical protein
LTRKVVAIIKIFSVMATLASWSGCAHPDTGGENLPGEGGAWIFNVTNKSGKPIALKATPLRGNNNAKADEGAQFLDGSIDEKSVASGTSTTLVTRTGRFSPGLDSFFVVRSFRFEVAGLSDDPIVFYGWPQKEVNDGKAQYYGLGYEEDGTVAVSSLAPGKNLIGPPVYNVVIEDANAIKWSLDERVKLEDLPLSPS